MEKVSRIETSLIHFDTSARFVPFYLHPGRVSCSGPREDPAAACVSRRGHGGGAHALLSAEHFLLGSATSRRCAARCWEGRGRGSWSRSNPAPAAHRGASQLRKASASRSGQSSLSRWTEPTLSSSLDLGSHHSRAGPDALKSGSSKPRRSSTSPSALLLSHVASVLDLAVGSTPILAQRVAALREASDVATFQHAKYWFQNSSFLAPHPASVASAPGTEKMGSKVAGFSRFRLSACCFA